MKWSSHRAVTFTSVLCLTSNLPVAVVSAMGSVFPDEIEFILFSNWQKHHRKTSHWIPLYLMICAVIYMLLTHFGMLIRSVNDIYIIMNMPYLMGMLFAGGNILFWFFFGCIFHILEDSVCGTIPLTSPNDKTKFIRLFYVGTIKEYVCVYTFCGLLLFYHFFC